MKEKKWLVLAVVQLIPLITLLGGYMFFDFTCKAEAELASKPCDDMSGGISSCARFHTLACPLVNAALLSIAVILLTILFSLYSFWRAQKKQ